MDFNSLIELKRKRFKQLESEIADQALISNHQRASEIMREHANIKQMLAMWDELEAARKQLDDNRELAMSRDVEIAAMADDEIPELEKRVADLERDLQIALLPADENEERDAIVEIHAGTGGNEAAIFAADLYRMYHRYAESAGLKTEDLESSPSELGGLKEAMFRVSGESVFRNLRYESGVHSAQRRGQIGTGGREEKIRTYNFPQNRVTDHRIGLTLYNLDRVMEGDLGELISGLQAADVAERLKESAVPA